MENKKSKKRVMRRKRDREQEQKLTPPMIEKEKLRPIVKQWSNMVFLCPKLKLLTSESKSKTCMFKERGRYDCDYAHNLEELHENRVKFVPFYRTEYCESKIMWNICIFGDMCMFAHNKYELR